MPILQQNKLKSIFTPYDPNNPFSVNAPLIQARSNRVPENLVPITAPDQGLIALRNHATPDADAFRGLLQNAPSRNDYQLGKVGKVLASIAGITEGARSGVSKGVTTARGLLDAPYERAAEDYNNKGNRLGKLAELEYRDLGDKTKLEVQIADDKLKQQKAIIDALQADSTIKLNAARAKDLADQATTRGKTIQKNDVTGQLEVVDTRDGSRQTIGQFAESVGQKETRARGMFSFQEGVRSRNAQTLEGIKFANDKELAKIRADYDIHRDAAKSNLDKKTNINATQSNAAFEGAYKETIVNNPGLVSLLFDRDDKGNLSLKSNLDKDNYKKFIAKIHQRVNNKLGKEVETVDFPDEINSSTPKITAPASNVPQVTSPESQVLRQTAIQAIKENYPDNPELLTNEDAIAEAMKQISASVPASEPQVNNQVSPVPAPIMSQPWRPAPGSLVDKFDPVGWATNPANLNWPTRRRYDIPLSGR